MDRIEELETLCESAFQSGGELHSGQRVRVREHLRCRQSGKSGVIVPCQPGWDDQTGHGDKLYHVKFDDPGLGIMGFVSQNLSLLR